MVDLIVVECPNCRVDLQIHSNQNRGYCPYCRREFILDLEGFDFRETGSKVICPTCKGKGVTKCVGIEPTYITKWFKTTEIFIEGCYGDGKCHISFFPDLTEGLSNYCRDGKCGWCKGTGKFLFIKCKFCDGTGDCQHCYGSGKCKFCNGRGEIRCRACDGRGYTRHR